MKAKRRPALLDNCPVPLTDTVPMSGEHESAFLAYARERLGHDWDYIRIVTRGFDLDRMDGTETVAEFFAAEEHHENTRLLKGLE